jgi:hypothetical protein
MRASRVGRALGCGAIVLAAIGVCVSPANAATGGLVYKVSNQKLLPSRVQATAKANCPNDTSVTGGGLTIIGGNTATGIASSYPFDDGDANSKPDDGWIGVANSRSAGDKAMRTYAICSKTGRYSYVRDTTLVVDHAQNSLMAPCEEGQSVTGGGLTLSGTSTVYAATATRPFDGGDADADEDDGWLAAVYNDSNSPQTVRAYAVCARSGTYQYSRFGPLAAPNGQQQATYLPCAGTSHVVGGGAEVLPGGAVDSKGLEVAAALPYDTGVDADAAPDDGWYAAGNNNSGVGAGFANYAICRG